jgi:hypothetical protein
LTRFAFFLGLPHGYVAFSRGLVGFSARAQDFLLGGFSAQPRLSR